MKSTPDVCQKARQMLCSANFMRSILPTRGRLIEAYVKFLARKPYKFYDPSGLIFEFQPDDHFADYIDRQLCNDDPGLIKYIRRTISPNSVVFDIGAHLGSVALSAAQAMSWTGIVYAFEPASANYERLLRNIQLNGASEVVIPLHLTVAESQGNVILHTFSSRHSGWHTMGWFELGGERPRDSEQVPCTSLDNFCRQRGIDKIDLLKVDVEGAEPKVFAGAQQLLSTHAVQRIVFELSLAPLQGMGSSSGDVVQPLLSNGYRIKRITLGGSVGERLYTFDSIRWANLVAIAPDMG